MNKIAILFSFTFLLIFVGCKKDKEKVAQEDIKVNIPSFNADTAYAYIAKQVEFGTRVVGTAPHKNCQKWLGQKLKEFGFEVTEQPFNAEFNGLLKTGFNIIGRYNKHVKERILLTAHWDTRYMAEKDSTRQDEPILGADDGGSGVGVILEIARQIKKSPIPMGVDIVFFDAEDQGENQGSKYTWGIGSQFWSRNLPEKNYQVKYGILLDMVGAKDAVFHKEYYSMQMAPQVMNAVWDLAKKMNHGKFFNPSMKARTVDDHIFVYEGSRIPMIDIINMDNNGFGDHHHTHKDDMSIIDKTTLQAAGQVVLAVVYKESNKEFMK